MPHIEGYYTPSPQDPPCDICLGCGTWVHEPGELCPECVQCDCGLIAWVNDHSCEGCGVRVQDMEGATEC